MSIKIKLAFARFLSLIILSSGIFCASAQAQMISAAHVQQQYDKTQLLDSLAQHNVQKAMLSMGVDESLVKERINNLTSEELAQLNTQIDELPVGSGIVGLAVFVFVVFVITDAIGATDVFPFVHKVQ